MKAAVFITICLGASSIGCLQASGAEVAPLRPEQLLRNMPVNTDFRCTGITLVAEALLEGQLLIGDECDRPEDLGKRIYDNAGTSSITSYRSKVCLEQGPVPIQSREALDRLTTEVSNLYKQRHLELVATDEGTRKIVAAQQAMIQTERELNAILDADRDKIHAFMAIGIREFPDASEKPTYHVVLIAKQKTGKKIVFDPNDPGTAIDCQFTETDEGLLVRWTCNYKDTGQLTKQEYLIVDRERFFRMALIR